MNCKCVICMDKFNKETGMCDCGHLFCKECIQKWVKESSQCPLCRNPITRVRYFEDSFFTGEETKVSFKRPMIKEEREEDISNFLFNDSFQVRSSVVDRSEFGYNFNFNSNFYSSHNERDRDRESECECECEYECEYEIGDEDEDEVYGEDFCDKEKEVEGIMKGRENNSTTLGLGIHNGQVRSLRKRRTGRERIAVEFESFFKRKSEKWKRRKEAEDGEDKCKEEGDGEGEGEGERDRKREISDKAFSALSERARKVVLMGIVRSEEAYQGVKEICEEERGKCGRGEEYIDSLLRRFMKKMSEKSRVCNENMNMNTNMNMNMNIDFNETQKRRRLMPLSNSF